MKEALQTQLWPVPALAVTVAVGLGVYLPMMDTALSGSLPPAVSAWLFGGGPEAARSILEVIAGSLITVTSLTFSLTVVTLQLASSQFSPRLLRTFTADRFVHGTLALFLASFAYALTVLRTIRTAENDRGEFVPEISVTLAFGLAISSVMALVLFLAHLARELRVETMLSRVHAETNDTINAVFPESKDELHSIPEPRDSIKHVEAERSGFLTGLDERALVRAAHSADAVVRLDRPLGSSLIRGVPIATVWTQAAGSPDAEVLTELSGKINASIFIEPERTSAQDVAFGFRQLVDVASRALSPGINDPTTAIHALSHLSSLLCHLVGRNPGPRVLTDQRGERRVILQLPTLEDLLDLALRQPLLYGSEDPAVMARMIELVLEVSWHDRHGKHEPALSAQVAQLTQALATATYTAEERRHLEQLLSRFPTSH